MSDKQTRSAGPVYELIQPKWLQHHTLDQFGAALLRDLERSVASYDWVHTDEERRQYVLESLVQIGSQLLRTASDEIRRDMRDRPRPRVAVRPIKMRSVPDPKLEVFVSEEARA